MESEKEEKKAPKTKDVDKSKSVNQKIAERLEYFNKLDEEEEKERKRRRNDPTI